MNMISGARNTLANGATVASYTYDAFGKTIAQIYDKEGKAYLVSMLAIIGKIIGKM